MAEFDEYKNHYEASIDSAIAFAGRSHAFYTKAKADCLIGLIKAKLGGLSNYRLLDIGCGNGAIHEFLLNSELEINLEGIDVAPEFLEQAHKNFPGVNYRVYDGKPCHSMTAASTASLRSASCIMCRRRSGQGSSRRCIA